MANLLTREHVRAINHMRAARTVAVMSVLVVIACGISALALVPTFIIARQESENLKTEIATLNTLVEDGRDDFGELALQDARDRLVMARAVADRGTTMTESLRNVLDAPVGIQLVSFSYTRTSGPTNLLVSGIADSRDALVTYIDRLRSKALFESVDVPIATVARTGGEFSVTVRGDF